MRLANLIATCALCVATPLMGFAPGDAHAQSATTISPPPNVSEPAPACKWGVMGRERLYLCPEYEADGTRVWRVLDRRPIAPVQTVQPAANPTPRAQPAPAPRRSTITPRIRPRVGVGVNTNGDVSVGAGVGVGVGILDIFFGVFD